MQNQSVLGRWITRVVAVVAVVGAPLVFSSGEAYATDFAVTNGDDSGAGSLRQAFDDASTTPGDDRVIVDPGVGTVTLTTGAVVHAPADGADLELQGNGVTIQQTTLNASVLVHESAGFFTVDKVTVAGGNGFDGTGILTNPGGLVLTDSTVRNNTRTAGSSFGGGVFANGGYTITNSTLHDNTQGATGGGPSSVTDSTIRNNDANPVSFGALVCVPGPVVVGGASSSSTLSVTNSTITDNTATATGGGRASGGVRACSTLTVTNSTISGNSAQGGGAFGGFEASSGGGGSSENVTLSGSTVSGNSATAGAGGAVGGGSGLVTITDSTISDNNALATVSFGATGGIQTAESVTNSTISNNTATATHTDSFAFGGLFLTPGTATVTGSEIKDNTATSVADSVGGIIAFFGDVTVTTSTISGNSGTASAGPATGGLGSFVANFTLSESTVSGNSASGVPATGGIGTGGDVSATNSTITMNAGTTGGITGNDITLVYVTMVENSGVQLESRDSDSDAGSLTSFGSIVAKPAGGGSNCTFGPAGTTTSNGYNFSDDASGSVGCKFSHPTDLVGPGNDPQLGPLANNGGPTETRMPSPTSPVVDVIPTSSCNFAGITTDQRGVNRPVGPRCDIGSVEIAGVPQTKDDCKNGGWQSLVDDEGQPFTNQGDCVSFVSTGGKNKAEG